MHTYVYTQHYVCTSTLYINCVCSQIEAGEGASTAISQLEQEKVHVHVHADNTVQCTS